MVDSSASAMFWSASFKRLFVGSSIRMSQTRRDRIWAFGCGNRTPFSLAILMSLKLCISENSCSKCTGIKSKFIGMLSFPGNGGSSCRCDDIPPERDEAPCETKTSCKSLKPKSMRAFSSTSWDISWPWVISLRGPSFNMEPNKGLPLWDLFLSWKHNIKKSLTSL